MILCYIYIYIIYTGEDPELIIHVFYWCIPLDQEIYTKCKKTSNLVIISALELKVNQKPFVIQY